MIDNQQKVSLPPGMAPILQPRDHILIHGSILVVLLLLEIFQPNSNELLSLRQFEVLENNQWWRIISGHLVHLSWQHTLLNVSGLFLITAIFLPTKRERQQTHSKWQFISAASPIMVITYYLTAAILTTLLIFIFNDDIKNYVGLSGVLYGLIIFYLICEFRITPALSGVALAAIFSKIVWDQFHDGSNHSTAEFIGGPVASIAHLYGGICGLLIGLVAQYRHQKAYRTS